MTAQIKSELTRAVIASNGNDGLGINDDGSVEILNPVVAPAGDQIMTAAQIAAAIAAIPPSSGMIFLAPQTAAASASLLFTGIPTTAVRITIMMSALVSNNVAPIMVQIGTSVGLEITGYMGRLAGVFYAAVEGDYLTAGFPIASAYGVADQFYGVIVLTRIAGNTWIQSGTVARNGVTQPGTAAAGGGKTLVGGAITQLSILSSVAATLTSGVVNVAYEE